MRIVTAGLSALVAATLATSPALAADEGEVGVVENVVEVTASATVEGYESITVDDGDCVWELALEDDLWVGVYDEHGVQIYSDTGAWFQLICDGDVVEVNRMFVAPEGGGFSEEDLLEQAKRIIDPALPTWSSSPDGQTVPMVVQMPTWLWVDESYWAGSYIGRAETPSQRMWAEAKAVPTATIWSPGDGTTVTCAGAGSQWSEASADPECSHTYRHSTAGSAGLTAAVTVEFEVWGWTSLSPTPVRLGTITRTSAPSTVRVGEIQALETNDT